MSDLEKRILALVARPGYQPLKPKAFFRKLDVAAELYGDFRTAAKKLLKEGKISLGKSHAIHPPAGAQGAITGVFRKAGAGFGFVRPSTSDGSPAQDIFVPEEYVGDAITGDSVLVRIRGKSREPGKGPRGMIVRVLERATRQFVGTYFERDGQALVRIDGTVFAHSVFVGDPGAKGAKPEDKVVLEMVRFPTPEERGEGVITEILGPRGQPGVDTLSIIRGLGLPDEFAQDALEEARQAAALFDEKKLHGREDFTTLLTITIDPPDAHDFDDAISLSVDPKSKHWQLGVHIADVSHFAQLGTALDREARKRATSVYLPQRVLPMFPELLSNGLASLQQGKVRFAKSVLFDLTPQGQIAHVRFANAAIKVTRRFAYDEVTEILEKLDAGASPAQLLGEGDLADELASLLLKGRELAKILHQRRLKRGALELNMPEAQLEYDKDGRVIGGHFRKQQISHQIVEEFMLMANEAVAAHLDRKGLAFLRRVHPSPDANKLKAFGEFVRHLGYKPRKETDRFTLQKILQQSADKPEVHAVHYALLRSLKQATYSPEKDDHYALASENYCHFTSPIRRYPDLVVHRLLDQLIRRGRAGSDYDELVILGDHCSKMERRAELAERELVKLKLLTYLSERIGLEMEVVITGVADYGFYGQAEMLPVEGLVHITTLPDDYYYFDAASHSLVGQRTSRRYRLGDKLMVKVARVDLQKRQLDLSIQGGRSRRGDKKPRG